MELPANMEPRSRLKPMHWKGSLICEQLLCAGELIGVNEAGRRTIQTGQSTEPNRRSGIAVPLR
jgi:gentisate 1,2-dioxygenase